MMKFLWGRKKEKPRAGDPEIPAPEPEPPSPLPPPEEPQPDLPPGEPAPTPDPAYPPGEPPTEIPPPEQERGAALEPWEPEALSQARPEPDMAPPAAEAELAEEESGAPAPSRGGFFSRLAEGLTQGLRRSTERLSESITAVFAKRKLDQDALDELEEALLAADLGPGPAARVIARLAAEKFDKEVTDSEVRAALADVVIETLAPHERDFDLSGPSPQVVLFVGVNGSGKTTTLGKIAAMIRRQGRLAVMAAGDTFRAAAIEQLQAWGERTRTPVIAREIGADASGLVYDAYAEAKRRGADVLLVDTAGRLQNKAGLMAELAKIVRVLKKQDESAPHHVLLVLDATVGQNALSQAQAFREIAGVTGLVMTKLDGTAKGGVLVALADKHPDLPIYFTGVGEGVDDLKPFSAREFAYALAGVELEPA